MLDGGSEADAGTAPSRDAAVDAMASEDALVPPGDTGIACPTPFVVCDGTCIDPRTTPEHCGATGACTGSQAGEHCGGACSAGACVFHDCAEALAAGHTTDGVYTLDIDGSGPLAPMPGYCDQTTDGGGWTLTYKIRNDVPNISDPWWGMVDLGSGTAMPTTLTPVASGMHFEGPTRSTRHAVCPTCDRDVNRAQSRATLVDTTGHLLLDVRAPDFGAIATVAGGSMGTPMAITPNVEIIGSSSGGAMGAAVEHFNTCMSGTCNDYAYVQTGSGIYPVYGDSSIETFGTQYANTTTLFWVRPVAP